MAIIMKLCGDVLDDEIFARISFIWEIHNPRIVVNISLTFPLISNKTARMTYTGP